MMTLQQLKFRLSGLPELALALLLPALLAGAVFSAPGAGSRFTAASTTLLDTTNIEATICTGITYEFGSQMLTESGTYTEIFEASDGSDSTVVLVLTVTPAPVTKLEAGICEGDSYEFFGETLTEKGLYSHTLTTDSGCDSIIELALNVVAYFEITRNATLCEGDTIFFAGLPRTETGIYIDSLTASGGCDSITILNLTVNKHATTNWEIGICEGSIFVFNEDTLDQSGTYVYVTPAANGCDSIVTLELNVAAYFETEFFVSICDGESYAFGGEDLTVSGTYMDSLVAEGGCDSTLILKLNVLPPTPTTFVATTICDNQTYTFGDLELTDPGTYTATLTGTNGCDSSVVLTLTVLPTSGADVSATICSDETYEIAGLSLNETGVYSFVFPAENGCDSTVVLNLMVLLAPETVFNETICFGDIFEFEGETLDASGVYSVAYTAENGCDSTIILNLEVLPELITNIEATICAGESYEFDGVLLTDPGFYSAVLSSELGCDSTINLTLNVAPQEETALSETICPGTTYSFNGEELSEPGEYTVVLMTVFGCDSTVTLTLNVFDPIPVTELSATICAGETYSFNGLALTTAGQYESILPGANGCDSVIVLQLDVLPVSSTEIEAVICAGESVEFNGLTLTETGSYTETLVGENGCDSITTLNLTVLPVFETNLEAAICANESYAFEGETLQTSGTYTAVLTAGNGCDSTIVLHLTVFPLSETQLNIAICSNEFYTFNGQNLNTSGTYTALYADANGCDSTVVLILEVLEAPITNLQATICSNESYDFNGEPLNMPGVYAQVYPAQNGCDSTVVLTLTVLPIADVTVSVQICEGSSYSFDGQDLVNAGTYFAALSSGNGCDSLVTLELAVLDTLVTTISASICAGESYQFTTELLTESGVYEAFFTASGNCDSLVVLNLTVLPVSTSEQEATICAGESYFFNGEELTASGSYPATLTNSVGCDSIATLILTVLDISGSETEAAICAGDSYSFNGEELTETGVYTALLTNAGGCDSTVTLSLTVLETSASAAAASICKGESYNFNGDELTEPGVYTALLTNAAGCDSLVTLQLQVLPPSETTLEAGICAGESYPFQGELLTEPGTYTAVLTGANGCDSTVVLTLLVATVNTNVSLQGNTLTAVATTATYQWVNCATNQPISGATGSTFTPSVTGSYAVIITLPNGCTALSVCTEVMVVSTGEVLATLPWQIQPNPARASTTIRLDGPLDAEIFLELFDQTGRLLQRQRFPEGARQLEIDLNTLQQGLYLARLTNGRFSSETKRLVKLTD